MPYKTREDLLQENEELKESLGAIYDQIAEVWDLENEEDEENDPENA